MVKLRNKDFQDFFLTLTKDTIKAKNKLLSIMFPFLIYNNLFRPNNIVHENCKTLWKILGKFLEENIDDDSVYSRVLAQDTSIDKD